MPATKKCPQCDAELPADAPAGICPKCLMRAALPGNPGNENSPTTPTTGFVPPEPEDLALHFPQLEILELLGRGGMGAGQRWLSGMRRSRLVRRLPVAREEDTVAPGGVMIRREETEHGQSLRGMWCESGDTLHQRGFGGRAGHRLQAAGV